MGIFELVLGGRSLVILQLSMMLVIAISVVAPITLRKFPFIPSLRVIVMTDNCILSSALAHLL